jgi:hypothetical protein
MSIKPAYGARDFWTVNGSRDFAYLPSGATPVSEKPIPVRLQRGDANAQWGHDHILADHSQWVKETGKCLPLLVLTKLSQPGGIYSTEVESKFKIRITLGPNALLVLKYVPGFDAFFGVTSLYYRNSKVDGTYIGKFAGCAVAQATLKANPIFVIEESAPAAAPPVANLPTAPAVQITVKKKRNYSLPAANIAVRTGTD